MPVISFLSSKGGVGKTTTAIILACELAREGTVTLIDADPTPRLTWWAENGPLPENISLIRCAEANRLPVIIGQESVKSDYVIIDVKGEEGLLGMYAAQNSHLVIIPYRADYQDGRDLTQTFAAVEAAAMSRNRPIPVMCLLTMIKPGAFLTRVQNAVVKGIAEAGYKSFPVIVHDRVPYAESHGAGGGIHDREIPTDAKTRKQLEAAKENAAALKHQIITKLDELYPET